MRTLRTSAAAMLLLAATGFATAQMRICDQAAKAFSIKAVMAPGEYKSSVTVDTQTVGFCNQKEADDAAALVATAVGIELRRMLEADLRKSEAPANIPPQVAKGTENSSLRFDGIIDAFVDAYVKVEKTFVDYARNHGLMYSGVVKAEIGSYDADTVFFMPKATFDEAHAIFKRPPFTNCGDLKFFSLNGDCDNHLTPKTVARCAGNPIGTPCPKVPGAVKTAEDKQ